MAHCPDSDNILVLNEPISRRDFIDGTLVASTEEAAVGAACPFAVGAQSPAASPEGWSGYDLGLSSAEWFDGFSRSVNARKHASCGVDRDAVGPDLPTAFTLFVDFAKPELPARVQGPHHAVSQLLDRVLT